MRLSSTLMPTRKETPADAEVASHKLLLRAGYMRQLARGVYSILPLGWRSVRKIEQIVREEMDRAGAQELRMPTLQPAEIWEETGRWQAYGPDLMRLQDRKSARFALGPTHEEVVTDIMRHDIQSYKQLPVSVYQIQTKFRDEVRPRFGLMRCREFIMKDGYSFDLTIEAAYETYARMYKAYERIFDRMGFDYRAVEADTGNIGGDRSHEFQVLAQTGEDKIASCPSCHYAANVEKAELQRTDIQASDAPMGDVELVATPGAKTIAEVTEHLGVEASALIKTLLYQVGEDVVAVLMRGDHDVNEVKLKTLLEGHFERPLADLELATDEVVTRVTGAPVGFAGPSRLREAVVMVADEAVSGMRNAIAGANRKNKHVKNINVGRDFEVAHFADLREAQQGDVCGRCGQGRFEIHKGIEVGHVFHLGTKYSEAMGAKLQDEHGELKALEMGCYGIGVTRILAAAIEQGHDDYGMILPMAIAPYQVMVLPLQMKDEEVVAAAEEIYTQLQEAGVEVLLDDRDLRAGGKFKDADLIGVPLRVSIGGRGLKEGNVEYKVRGSEGHELISKDAIVAHVRQAVDAAMGVSQ